MAISVGTGIASSLLALSVRASEANLAQLQSHNELILTQADYDNRAVNSPYRLDNDQPTKSLPNIIGLTGLAIATGVVGYHLTHTDKPSFASSLPTVNNVDHTEILSHISPKLRRELLRLVHNQQTANRLLSGTSTSHPGRSANWLAEKVIYDLKRGR